MFKVFGVQKLELDLDEEEAKRITVRYLCEKFDWLEDFFIENDEVCKLVTYHTSHRWDQKECVRKATQSDKHIYSILKDLKKNS